MTSSVSVRPASPDDAPFLVPLVAEASGGVWPAVWVAMARDSESGHEAAVRYLLDDKNLLSTRNALVAYAGETRLGAMIAYQEPGQTSSAAQSDGGAPLPPDLARALAPYRELSDPESFFIAELCLLPEARGQGVGTHFLGLAVDMARQRQLPRITLRVFSENSAAVRLYKRFGFEIVGERPVRPHPTITVSGAVYLMSLTVR